MQNEFPLAGYRRALRFAIPYWPKLALVMFTGIVATSFGLAQPYISKLLIDEALLRRNFGALVEISVLLVVAAILSFALNILSSYQYVRVSAAVLFDMRLALYRHLQTLSPRFWTTMKLGDVVSRINNDVAEVQRVSADSVLSIFSNIVFLVGSAAIMASLYWKLFLVSVAFLPVSVWALAHYQQRLADRVRTVRERSSEIGSFLLETLLGMRVVIATSAESREVKRFQSRNREFVDALLKMQLTSFLSGAVPGVVLTLCTAALFLYGGKLVIDGQITTGTLVALMAYHARLLAPLQNLMSLYSSLISGGVSLSRVWELFDATPEVLEIPGARGLISVRGEIECDSLAFRHRDHQLFRDLSFHVPAGSICAIVGPSGIGKSTLADLLIRLYDPDSGSIRLDGTDLRELRLGDLRRSVMLLDQNPYLFHATVQENIAYARPDATENEITAAAQAASIHERILLLPEGYRTTLAERGQTLSAGERQRLALARALLADPKVLILDEPTSSLDDVNEQAIADTLEAALRGRTAIVITHRPAVARIAHQRVVLGA